MKRLANKRRTNRRRDENLVEARRMGGWHGYVSAVAGVHRFPGLVGIDLTTRTRRRIAKREREAREESP